MTLLDSWMVGRTGHTAFSNAWMIVALPDDDIDGITREIVAGNDGIADQLLVRYSLEQSYARLKDFEAIGMKFHRADDGSYARRPTRGLDLARVMYPEGGGLEYCWRLRLALEAEGVQLLDRIFVTGLLRGDDDRIVGAAGIHSRTGVFHVIKARATIVCTNALTFRSGFVRDITGTGTLLAYRAGAALRNAEFSYVRPGTPKFYFEGITFAIQEGAHFVNAKGEPFMREYEPDWADEADVPRIARAMALEKDKGNDPLYLDMSADPRGHAGILHPEQGEMDGLFLPQARIGSAHRHVRQDALLCAQPDDQDGNPHRPGLPRRRSGPLRRRAGAGRLRQSFRRLPHRAVQRQRLGGRTQRHRGPRPAAAADARCRRRSSCCTTTRMRPLNAAATAESDRILRDLQAVMFAYDVGILKSADRLQQALQSVDALDQQFQELAAPHTHELVRLKETEAMLLAARFMLGASLQRTESRLSHFREDHPQRDDENWLVWIDVVPGAERTRTDENADPDAAVPGPDASGPSDAAPPAPRGRGQLGHCDLPIEAISRHASALQILLQTPQVLLQRVRLGPYPKFRYCFDIT